MNSFTRRDFVTSTVVGGVALTGASLGETIPVSYFYESTGEP
jgi:hypothetical protein